MKTDQEILFELINNDFELDKSFNHAQIHHFLEAAFADLIDYNFAKLLQILYRADVNQDELKRLLDKAHGQNSAEIIANLYLNRQMAKVETRKKYNQKRI